MFAGDRDDAGFTCLTFRPLIRIMQSRRRTIAPIALVAAVALVAPSCHIADVTAPAGPANIHVAFTGDSVMLAGARLLPAVTVTSGTAPVVAPRLRFISSDTTVVAIAPSGDSLVARRLGSARVTASLESSLLPDAPPSATRTVVVVPKSLAIAPATTLFDAVGDTTTLTVVASDVNGVAIDSVAARWQLARRADTTIVRLAAGHVTAAGTGSADVLALVGADTARTTITVAPKLARWLFATPTVTLDALGADTLLTVTPLDANGNVITGSTLTPGWESADTTTAVVDGTGRVRAVRNGTTWIRAHRPAPATGVDSATVVVNQRAVRVTILPPTRTTLGTRDTLTVDAVAVDRLGHTVTNNVPRWSSSVTSVIDFGQGAAGNRVQLNSYAPGKSTIMAVLDGQRDSVMMTVINEPAVIRLVPDSAFIAAARDSTQMRATVYNASGDSIPGAAVTWATPDTLVARVATPGWFVAVDSGRARVIARTIASNGIVLADTSVVVVTNIPRVVRMGLAVDTLTVLGAQQLLPIQILNAINDTLPRTRVHWDTRDGSVVSVNSVGQVTAMGSGATWVVAWADSARDSTRVVVYNLAASVSIDGKVSGVPDTIPGPGIALTYTATVRNNSGGVVSGYPLTWTSTIPAVATVTTSGVVNAVGFGSTNVIVRAGAAADTVVVVVRRPTHWHVDVGRAGAVQFGTWARPFATIGGATGTASAGDTVLVAAGGTYRETVSLAKTLTIAGDSSAFLAAGRDPTQLPAIVNTTGNGAILVTAGAVDLRDLVVRHTTSGPALAASGADVNLRSFYVNPGSASTPSGSGILIDNAPQTARLDSVVVEGVVGYGVRIHGSAGVRVLRTRVHGVLAAGTGTSEDGVGIEVTGSRGAMVSYATVRTTDGAQLRLATTADATLNFGTFTGQRQLVLIDTVSGLTTVSDNAFDLARPADESYTGTSATDGRAGLTIRGSSGVQAQRNRFRDANGVNSQMDAMRLESAPSTAIAATHFTGGRRAVLSFSSSWTLTASRADSIALAIESTGDTLRLADDTLVTAGAGCASARRSEATFTRIVASQCGVGGTPAFGFIGGGATLDTLSLSGSNPQAIVADSTRRVLVHAATVFGPGALTAGVGGAGGIQLTGDSVGVVNSFVTGFPDRAALYLTGNVVARADSNSVNRSNVALQIVGAPPTLNLHDDDLYDADSAALILASGSAPNVWWGDGRGPRGTTTASVGDTIIGTVVTSPLRTIPLRPGTAASRMIMLRGDGQSVVTNGVYTWLPYALSVRVTDANGLPVRNVAVKFVVNSTARIDFGSGVKSQNVITNDSGIAESTVRIRDKGTFTITVTAPGVSDTITFTETGN